MGDSKLKIIDDKTELMAIGTWSKLNQVIPNLTPCPSLVNIFHSFSLLETFVSTEMKHSQWMHIIDRAFEPD